jgi:PAS domain S-box-containing protein
VDVTAMRRTGEAFALQSDELQTLLDSSPDFIYFKDAHCRFTRVNRAHSRSFGTEHPDDLVGKTDLDVYPTAFGAARLEEERRILETGQPLINAVEELTLATGEQRWLLSTKVPIVHDGVVKGLVGISRDVTELQQAINRRLKDAEVATIRAELETALARRGELREVLRDCAEILVQDLDVRACRIWTLDADETWLELAANAGNALPPSLLAQRVAVGTGLIGCIAADELPYVTDDLSHSPVTSAYDMQVFGEDCRSLAACPLGVSGRLLGVLAIASDRPLRDIAPDVLATAGFSLARGIVDRQQEDMLRTVAEADRANRAKTEFLSRMSHELRTPLNAVLGFAQVLEVSSPLTPLQERGIHHILKGGTHLLHLINEVLDIVRVESDRLALSLESVRVAAVVEESIDLIAPLAARAGVQLDADMPAAATWMVKADKQRLKQALINLLNNAVKYNHPGGHVALTCAPQPEGHVRISVIDTGSGIAPELQARLFTPFDRLGAEHTTIEGTGLGLALTKRLVEAMGGSLGLRSTLDGGSTFWIDLAAAEDALCESDGPRSVEVAELLPGVAVRTILYIEDNASNVELLRAIFSQQPDIAVQTAGDGRTGLQLATSCHPDVILLDLNLPDMHGSEVLARLKGDEQLRELPVVIVSADATPGQVRRLLAAGAHAYLTKPFDVRELLGTLSQLLTSREADPAPAATCAMHGQPA